MSDNCCVTGAQLPHGITSNRNHSNNNRCSSTSPTFTESSGRSRTQEISENLCDYYVLHLSMNIVSYDNIYHNIDYNWEFWHVKVTSVITSAVPSILGSYQISDSLQAVNTMNRNSDMRLAAGNSRGYPSNSSDYTETIEHKPDVTAHHNPYYHHSNGHDEFYGSPPQVAEQKYRPPSALHHRMNNSGESVRTSASVYINVTMYFLII